MVRAWYLEPTGDIDLSVSVLGEKQLLDQEEVTTTTGVRCYHVSDNIATPSMSVNTETKTSHVLNINNKALFAIFNMQVRFVLNKNVLWR